VLEKPTVDTVDSSWERRFVAAVKLIAKIKVITHVRARLSGTERVVAAVPVQSAISPKSKRRDQPQTRNYRVVAIGASTGGPAAIVNVLKALPPGLRVPVFFVLHIDEPFAAAFAEWLDHQTPHRVAYARDREPIESLRGQVIMAPPGRHLSIDGGLVHLNSAPPRHSCRPSVDVLFESLAVDRGAEVVACLLTGMGRDGAAGLLAIRQAGGFTLAQDESTSVVYGMPREAVLLEAAQLVLPLDQIGPQIVKLFGDSERRTA
jgi:two-component system, chemotaxis family, protein-glutamate methylesterase/glutaminase